MPRWRRKRDEEQEALVFDDAPDETPSLDDVSHEDEAWPDWAYEERPRRAHRSRRRRSRRKSTRDEEPQRPFDVEDIHDEGERDQDIHHDGGVEPGLWVGTAPAAEDNNLEEPTETPAAHEPVWSTEEEQRLRDLGDTREQEASDEPSVIVDPLPEWSGSIGYEAEAAEEEDGYEHPPEDPSDDADEYPDDQAPHQPVVGDVVPGEVGPRRAALHERRRKRRLALIGGAVALLVGLFAISAVTGGDDTDDDDRRDNSGAIAEGRDDEVETMLLYGTRENDPADGAKWLTLLSIDRSEGRGSVVYIPAHTAVEVPGRGLLPLGEAVSGDDVPLLLVTTEGLLGIKIDSYLEISDRDARVLFSDLGPLEVDVPSEVSVPAGSGQTQLIFTEGSQTIPGERIEELLFVTGVDGDDVELGSRHLAFWDALFDTYGGRTEELEDKIRSAGDVLDESDRSVDENADLFGDLAGFPEDAMVLNALPVQQVGVGAEGELYSTDESEIENFVQDTIGARSFVGSETRIQILNGNGVPGIGDDVAELLVGEGYRVILSGNARSLDYEETLIIIYERTDEAIDLAERAQELLGVGEIQVAGQEQGIVDLTIVVGKDFLRRNR